MNLLFNKGRGNDEKLGINYSIFVYVCLIYRSNWVVDFDADTSTCFNWVDSFMP